MTFMNYEAFVFYMLIFVFYFKSVKNKLLFTMTAYTGQTRTTQAYCALPYGTPNHGRL